jgi:WD40 repeat protein
LWLLQPGGFEKLAATNSDRFLLAREQLDAAGQNVQTAIWQLEADRPPHMLRVIRPSLPGDRRRFLDSGLTPDGRLHWWVGPREPSANRRVEVRRVDNGEPIRIWPSSTDSRNGLGIYVDPAGQRMWVTDLEDGTSLRLESSGGPPVSVDQCPVAVSGGGAWQAFVVFDQRRGQSVLALRNGDVGRPWLEFASDDRHGPLGTCFSPNSRYLAWGSRSGAITLIDLPALQKTVVEFEAGQQSGDGSSGSVTAAR